jgi:hypothetical protein
MPSNRPDKPVGAESGAPTEPFAELARFKEAIRDEIITDQATGAGDYSEAEEYADKIIAQAAQGCGGVSANEPSPRYFLATVEQLSQAARQIAERRHEIVTMYGVDYAYEMVLDILTSILGQP